VNGKTGKIMKRASIGAQLKAILITFTLYLVSTHTFADECYMQQHIVRPVLFYHSNT